MSIIAAIDLSPASVNAARSATDLARMLRESVVLVQAVAPMSAFYPESVLAGAVGVDDSVRRATEAALENVRLSLAAEAPEVTIEARVVNGRAYEVLCRSAIEENARLIVMGSLGRGPGGRLLVGSVAQRTVRQAPCPVLVLRVGNTPFSAWAQNKRPLRVMVGLDRAAGPNAALDFISVLRAAGPCDVTLVHEYWPAGEYARLGLRGPRDISRDDAEVISVLDRDLRAHLPHLGGAGQVALRIRASWGPVGAALALDAQAEEVDLLVLGSEQPHGLERLRNGSDALSALHTSEVALLVVPEHKRLQSLPSRVDIPVVRSVLVATDLSEPGNAAIPHAYALARRGGARVELCHVHERGLGIPAYVLPGERPEMPAQQRKELELRLAAQIPQQAVELGISSHATVIDGGSTPEQILAAARRLGVDAIVLSSHGRSGLSRALMGSVAEAVVRGSDRPVYVIRPAQAAAA